ncbi:MAG: hypothetical protein AAFP96_08425 [Bacteroidota bacterium]
MKASIVRFAFISMIFATLLSGFSTSLFACTKTFVNRNGTVYAGGPAKSTFTSTANSITVRVSKTDGKAQTIVNIYVNNVRKGFIEFNNGNYTKTKTKTISGTKGKSVRVEIVNQSVANKFKYTMKVTGTSDDLGSQTANLVGQTQKSVTFTKPCKNTIRITIRRTSGKARANVFIYRDGRKIFDEVLDKNETTITRTYTGAKAKSYKAVVKNVSVGNTIGVKISATQQ